MGTGAFVAGILLAGQQAPGIVVAEPDYNFGQLSETSTLSHDFIIRNNGETSLNIQDVQPS
jgi:hypothetical protein